MSPIAGWTSVDHPATGFTALAPQGSELAYDDARALYSISTSDPERVFWYSHIGGAHEPIDVLRSWAEPREFRIDGEHFNAGWARLDVTAPDGGGWTAQAQRDESGMLEFSSYGPYGAEDTPEQRLDDERALSMMFASARGGTVAAVRVGGEAAPEPAAPAPEPPAEPLPLRDWKADDGTASGRVPSGPGWEVGGASGMLLATHPELGELVMGMNGAITFPNGLDAMAAQMGIQTKGMSSPFLGAEQALLQLWLPWRRSIWTQDPFADVQVERRDHMTSSTVGTSGVFTVTLTRAGAPWRGVVAVTTKYDSPNPYWKFHWASRLVPQGGDPRVWTALTEAWNSFRPASRGPSQTEIDSRKAVIDSRKAWFAGLTEMNLKRRQAAGFAPRSPQG